MVEPTEYIDNLNKYWTVLAVAQHLNLLLSIEKGRLGSVGLYNLAL